MQTLLSSDDLDLLTWGMCPECGESYCLIQHDDKHYECECGWTFTVSNGEVIASDEHADETKYDVFS